MSIKTIEFFVLTLLIASTAAFGQVPQPTRDRDEVIRIETELIDVPVVVTDRSGKPILNLKQSNFVVFEDGKPQDIDGFSTTNAPFEVALLLDTSGSTRGDLEMIRRAARQFIASLRAGDCVAIIAFRSAVVEDRGTATSEVISSLTSDRGVLTAALDRVNTSNGTPYYDSLLEIAEKVFGKAPSDEFRGRRALVALTDGVDSTSASGFDEARSELTAKGISAYFIQVDTRPFFEENLLGDCEGATRFSQAQIRRYYASFNPKAKIERTSDFCRLGDFERLAISKRLYELADTEMNSLAKLSGGRVFPAASLNDARAAFQMVADEIGTKYSLGYYSSNERRDGKFRSIRVEVKGLPAGATVRAREGYTAPPK